VAGEYHLLRPPADVSLGEVMDAIGNSTSTGRGPAASPDSPAVKVLMKAWQRLDADVSEILSGITFAELVHRAKQADAPMYHI
jgi:DNA-binding IscR family transcriptional regulator